LDQEIEQDADRQGGLRGRQRRQVAASVADEYRNHGKTVHELAAGIGRRPSLVRRLLLEAGVVLDRSDGAQPGDVDLAQTLARRWCRGSSIAALVRDTGMDRRAIRRLIEGTGVIVPNRRSRPSDSAEDLVSRYRAGTSIRSLAKLTGSSYGSIRAVLLDAGVCLRPRGGGHSPS
jgi:hypothetical protein